MVIWSKSKSRQGHVIIAVHHQSNNHSLLTLHESMTTADQSIFPHCTWTRISRMQQQQQSQCFLNDHYPTSNSNRFSSWELMPSLSLFQICQSKPHTMQYHHHIKIWQLYSMGWHCAHSKTFATRRTMQALSTNVAWETFQLQTVWHFPHFNNGYPHSPIPYYQAVSCGRSK